MCKLLAFLQTSGLQWLSIADIPDLKFVVLEYIWPIDVLQNVKLGHVKKYPGLS